MVFRTVYLALGLVGLIWALGLAVAQTPEPQEEDLAASEDGVEGTESRGLRALSLEVKGAIGPVTANFFIDTLKRANDEEFDLVIVEMDTPGGLDSAMRDMIREILASPVPVVTYVTPQGARAASAGTYILYASHVAAMAPATTLGAATPVQMGGLPGTPSGDGDEGDSAGERDSSDDRGGSGASERGDEGGAAEANDTAEGAGDGEAGDSAAGDADQGQSGTDEGGDGESSGVSGDAMSRKMVNDAAAYIRGLAELRGRNKEWAERAVREAVSLTSEEAVEKNVIDVIAEDLDELLVKIDGQTVTANEEEVVISTQGMRVEKVEPDWKTKLLSVITNPNIAYLLMLFGFYGLIFELSNPGFGVSGVLGALSLLLAMFAFQMLPINYVGLAFIVLGVVFIASEAFVPSFGILGAGGVVSLVFGSLLLIDSDLPGYGVSIPLVLGFALFTAFFILLVLNLAVRNARRQVQTGAEAMLASIGEAMHDFEREGRVWVQGESWKALTQEPLREGDRVQILEVDGLTLRVAPERAKRRVKSKGRRRR